MDDVVRYSSEEYNWVFDKVTGFFARWGETKEQDPSFSPIGPEILDIEVSDICSQGCSHCYKSNTQAGINMTLDTFKKILSKMPPNLTQIAFGIGDIDANPDLFKMFAYCRSNGVIPNVTINGARLTDNSVESLAKLCGGVAVSNYNKDICYNAVERLLSKGLQQVNIHQLLSQETLDQCYSVVANAKSDSRLAHLRAVVFLTLKPKGERNTYKSLTLSQYKKFIKYLTGTGVNFGFDSCAANNFIGSVGTNKYNVFAEPCESCLFSSYVNVKGEFFPCSFAEEGKGLSVLECDNFLEDIWNSGRTEEFRKKLLENGRNCPIFNLDLTER